MASPTGSPRVPAGLAGHRNPADPAPAAAGGGLNPFAASSVSNDQLSSGPAAFPAVGALPWASDATAAESPRPLLAAADAGAPGLGTSAQLLDMGTSGSLGQGTGEWEGLGLVDLGRTDEQAAAWGGGDSGPPPPPAQATTAAASSVLYYSSAHGEASDVEIGGASGGGGGGSHPSPGLGGVRRRSNGGNPVSPPAAIPTGGGSEVERWDMPRAETSELDDLVLGASAAAASASMRASPSMVAEPRAPMPPPEQEFSWEPAAAPPASDAYPSYDQNAYPADGGYPQPEPGGDAGGGGNWWDQAPGEGAPPSMPPQQQQPQPGPGEQPWYQGEAQPAPADGQWGGWLQICL
jgi:hypothetical protein